MSTTGYTFDAIPDWGTLVLKAPKTVLGPMTKLVLLALSHCATKMGPVAWTSAKALSLLTSLSEGDIKKALTLAQKTGYLKRVRQTDRYGNWEGWKYVATYPTGVPGPIETTYTGDMEHYKAKTWEEAEGLVNEKLKG